MKPEVKQGKQKAAATTALALVTLPGLLAGCGRSEAQATEAPRTAAAKSAGSGIAVSLVPVETRPSQDSLRVSGQVMAWRTATVAAEVGETVTRLPIEAGKSVAAGGLLATLDDRASKAALAEAEAAHSQATAARRQLEAEYARVSVETRASIAAARAQIAGSEAGIRQAKAQVIQAREGERRAKSATRSQELLQAESNYRRTVADEVLAKTDLDRYTTLVREGALAQQTLDRARAAYEGAKANREAAGESLSLAREGARAEDIRSATASVAQASAAVTSGAARRDEARATLAIAGTRDARLTALRRQIDGLRAGEARAAAAVTQARILYSKHRIVAPFGGRILAKLTETGETVAAGTPVARIGEIGRVKATFAVPEAARRGLRTGQTVAVTADALPGRAFRGRVFTVGYQAEQRARTFTVEVEVPNPGERLLPNMAVRLALPAAKGKDTVTVPVSAVASDGGKTFAFTVAGNKAVRRVVTLGPVAGDRVLVKSGLSAGDRIVAAPQRLTDGATVHTVGESAGEGNR
jgi:RND family efflux transporter MFP subunit